MAEEDVEKAISEYGANFNREKLMYAEVSASGLLNAYRRLKGSESGAADVSEDDLWGYFGVSEVKGIGQGKRLYLIKAVYGQPQPAGFSVLRYGSLIVVQHEFLGECNAPMKTALLLWLEAPPVKVLPILAPAL